MENEHDRYNRLTELNVHEQCLNILKLMEVQLAFKERGLTVHGWVFDIKTGKIIDMNVDFVSIIPELGGIYTVF
jgi:carbonic anhydrase